jgi:hypothetical protein
MRQFAEEVPLGGLPAEPKTAVEAQSRERAAYR